MRAIFAMIPFGAWIAIAPSNALALSLPDDRRLHIDPQDAAVDSLPPDIPQASVRAVIRGVSVPEADMGDVCHNWVWRRGAVVFDIAPPDDDRTRDLDLGYVFELVSGNLPTGMELRHEPCCHVACSEQRANACGQGSPLMPGE